MGIKDIRGISSSFERYVKSVALAANNVGDADTVTLCRNVLEAPSLRAFSKAVDVLEAHLRQLEAGEGDADDKG